MKNFLISIIKFYQKISSKTTKRCRFVPTCSQYTIEALQYYGAARGLLMGIWRILRCNPFSKGGYDPIPIPPNKK